MNTLKESSMWISTNKKLSTEKPISKWLADELTTIMEFSTAVQKTSTNQYLRNNLGIRVMWTNTSLKSYA
jgi:hypothetical protein